MKKIAKYKYHYRPGSYSDNFLIEFFSGVEDKDFINDLFDAIKVISPKTSGKEDLWMNDEILYKVSSKIGTFILSKDIWNLAYIMSENNQSTVSLINDLLVVDNRFEKIEVEDIDQLKENNASS